MKIQPRVIPILLLKNNGLYKTIKFKDQKYIGDPINAIKIFNEKEVDEMIFLDIMASREGRSPNFEMLKELRDNYKGEIHVSFGMTTINEEKEVIDFFEITNQASSRLVIYSCTSGYPVPFSDVCLLEIPRLYQEYSSRVKNIGFSGHHLGIAVDIAAYTLGANWIERNFTKDRSWKGTDHSASLEVPGMQKLVRDLDHTFEALNYKKSEILEIEEVQRKKLKNKK